MNRLEILAKLLPGSPGMASLKNYAPGRPRIDEDGEIIQPTVVGSSSRNGGDSGSVELAGALQGLSIEQEQLIWCKYLNEGQACAKGLKAFRTLLYSNKDTMKWVFVKDTDECEDSARLSTKCQNLIDLRTTVSAILSACAYNDLVGSFRCETCAGAGSFELPDKGVIKCAECRGRGFEGDRTTAQHRADKLHVPLRTYYRKYHSPFVEHYWKPAVAIETEAIIRLNENLG